MILSAPIVYLESEIIVTTKTSRDRMNISVEDVGWPRSHLDYTFIDNSGLKNRASRLYLYNNSLLGGSRNSNNY
jgi:hypothetical protein